MRILLVLFVTFLITVVEIVLTRSFCKDPFPGLLAAILFAPLWFLILIVPVLRISYKVRTQEPDYIQMQVVNDIAAIRRSSGNKQTW
jgi:hypothetical protein